MSDGSEALPGVEKDAQTSDDLIDALNDTMALRCCDCASCNHYAPDFAEHEGEPCRTWELIRAYADAYCRETHVFPPGGGRA